MVVSGAQNGKGFRPSLHRSSFELFSSHQHDKEVIEQ